MSDMELTHKEEYFLLELPAHLEASYKHDRLRQILTDVQFLDAKIHHFFTPAVLADFALKSIRGESIYQLLSKTIQQNAHIFDRCEERIELSNTLITRLLMQENLETILHNYKHKVNRPYITSIKPLPDKPSTFELKTINHDAEIRSLVFSLDGNFIISAGGDTLVRFWDVATGQPVKALRGHQANLTHIKIDKSGEKLLSASEDQTLILWKFETGEILHTLRGHKNIVSNCALHPSGEYALSVSEDNTAILWALDSGSIVTTHVHDENTPSACVFFNKSNSYAIGFKNGEVRFYKNGEHEPYLSIRPHQQRIHHCETNLKDKIIITTCEDHSLTVWDLKKNKAIRSLTGHEDEVTYATYSSNDKFLVSVSRDEKILIWDTGTWETHATLTGHTAPYEGGLLGCAISPDSQLIASGSVFDSIKIWQLPQTPTQEAILDRPIYSCKFSQCSNLLITHNGSINIWNSENWQKVSTLTEKEYPIGVCNISPDADFLVIGSSSGRLTVLNYPALDAALDIQAHDVGVNQIAVSQSKDIFVTASDDHTVKIWDRDSGKLLNTLEGHTGDVFSCAISPDERVVVSASIDESLIVWDRQSGRQIRNLDDHNAAVVNCEFNRDGSLLLSASHDGTANVWNTRTWEITNRLIGHLAWVTDGAFCPNGKHLATSSQDETIRIWDIYSKKTVSILRVDGWLESIAWHPNGSHLVVTGQKGIYFLKVIW